MIFKGSIPALITPFKKGKVDYESFNNIIEWSIHEGSHGFVPCGTTGESPTLSHEEHKNIIKECIKTLYFTVIVRISMNTYKHFSIRSIRHFCTFQ